MHMGPYATRSTASTMARMDPDKLTAIKEEKGCAWDRPETVMLVGGRQSGERESDMERSLGRSLALPALQGPASPALPGASHHHSALQPVPAAKCRLVSYPCHSPQVSFNLKTGLRAVRDTNYQRFTKQVCVRAYPCMRR